MICGISQYFGFVLLPGVNAPLGQGHVPPAPVAPLAPAVAIGGGGGGGVLSSAKGQVKLAGATQGDLESKFIKIVVFTTL